MSHPFFTNQVIANKNAYNPATYIPPNQRKEIQSNIIKSPQQKVKPIIQPIIQPNIIDPSKKEINLKYIIVKKPSTKIVRNFMRTQIQNIFSEEELLFNKEI
jgi:hypothetical protein